MSDRVTIIAAPEFTALRASLRSRIDAIHERITPENFGSLLTQQCRRLLHQSFDQIGADEGTIWLLDVDREHVIPVYNTGPNANRFVLQFRQPVSSGLIGMVVANHLPFVENDVPSNARQDGTLDRMLNVTTTALLAVPLSVSLGCVGVISAVKLTPRGEHQVKRFSSDAIESVTFASGLIAQLLDYQILSGVVGWSTA